MMGWVEKALFQHALWVKSECYWAIRTSFRDDEQRLMQLLRL
jgi:hypothetical protein